MKRLFKNTLIFAVAFALFFTLFSCGEEPKPEEPKEEACIAHTDNNGDSKCDKCGADLTPEEPECTEHKDENGDNKCDTCGADLTPEEPECTEHKDENGDGKCDKCGADLTPEEPECTEHKDEDGDYKCDDCGADITPEAPSSSLTLIDNGEGKFKFVLSSSSSDELTEALGELIKNLEDLGVSTEAVSDSADTESAVEVLIGAVETRGEQYKLDAHALGYEGYCIKLIDGKVVILGGSDEALKDALSVFKKDILGINKKTEKLDTVVMKEADNIEIIQDNYTVKSVLVAGNDFKSYVILTDLESAESMDAARTVQENIYKKLGVWLNITDDAEESKYVHVKLTTAKTCESDKGFIAKVENGNIILDCGFKNKIQDATLSFIMSKITNQRTEEVVLKEGFTYEKEDYKNIYYKDFGAQGDGNADDFYAIKACHDEANKYGHTVNGEKNATYYIGTAYQKTLETIEIKTDVNWNGAHFIIDDSIVTVQYYDHIDADNNKVCERCKRAITDVCSAKGTSWHYTNIFTVTSDSISEDITHKFEGRSLPKETTNIGFAPGRPALLFIESNETKHFIRYGVNQNSGSNQHEILLVDAEGNIDSKAPLHWTYNKVSYAEIVYVDDDPITIGGGTFQTIANQAENYYNAYGRSISIERSNVTVKDIEHTITDEGPTRAPYYGFLRFSFTYNVVFDNIKVQHHANRYDKSSGALLGTYEFQGSHSYDTYWYNIDQFNFFEDDGSVSYKGLFGTNYCKNFYFDNCTLTSLDAHSGVYNVSVKNSTFEHMNFIGEGLIDIQNTVVYSDATKVGLKFRSDYGSTWNGEVRIDGLEIKYSDPKPGNESVDPKESHISLMETTYTDWWFGFTTYLPHTVKINNVKLTKYTQKTVNGVREETVVGTNLIPLYMYSVSIHNATGDISKLKKDGGDANYNPYIGTKLIEVTNCGDLDIKIPKTKQFRDLEYYLNGVKQENW